MKELQLQDNVYFTLLSSRYKTPISSVGAPNPRRENSYTDCKGKLAVLFVSAGKVIVGIAFWDNADASADIAVACAKTVEGTIGDSSDDEYRRHFCDVVERLACCVSGTEQFSSPVEEPFSCVSEVVDADTTDLLGANGLAAAVSLDCFALEVSDV